MKIHRFAFTLGISLFLIFNSCNYDPARGPDGGGGDESETSVEDSERDFTELKKFAHMALSDAKMEMELSQMAIEKSGNASVQNLAQMIKSEHQKANEELMDILYDYDWDISKEMLEKHKQKIEKLQEAAEEETDQIYLGMMIESHETAIRKFKSIGQDSIMLGGGKLDDMTTPQKADDTGGNEDAITPTGIQNKDQSYETYTRENKESDQQENEMEAPYASAVGAPELKRWIDSTLPILEKHLDQAKQVQSQL